MHIKLETFLEALKEDQPVFLAFEQQLVRRLEGAKFEGRPFNYTKPPEKEEKVDINDSVARFNQVMGVPADNHLTHGATV